MLQDNNKDDGEMLSSFLIENFTDRDCNLLVSILKKIHIIVID